MIGQIVIGIDGSPNSLAVADFNEDGKLDVVVADSNGHVGVLLGNGDGTFRPAMTYHCGPYAILWAIVDLNGDGTPDLVVDTSVVTVLLGNGDGTFQAAVLYDSGGLGARSPALADVNGDGTPDLLVVNECVDSTCAEGSVGVLLGNGDGTFQSAQTFDSGGYEPLQMVIADVNGDGKPDLVLAIYNALQSCGDCVNPPPGLADVLINTSLTPTATVLTSTVQNPSYFGQSVTFTATVAAQPGFYKGAPSGSVSFFDGTANLGSSKLDTSGVAIFSTNALPVGTRSVVAVYNGDENCVPSTSPPVRQIVQGAVVVLSKGSLSFGNQLVGIASTAESMTLTNSGNITLTMSIGMAGTNSTDFVQTNTCGTSVSAGLSCTIAVTFTPTATGTRNATLTITDNASDSPQAITVSGTGQDFSIVPSSASATLTSGQIANYALSIVPGGGFDQSVLFSCSGAPAHSSCSVTPGSITLNGSNSVSVDVSVVTQGAAMALNQTLDRPIGGGWVWVAWLGVMGMLVLKGTYRRRRSQNPRWTSGFTLLCLLAVGVATSACGDGSSNSSGGGGVGGTPSGTYTLTAAGTFTSGSTTLTHSTKLTLVVQ